MTASKILFVIDYFRDPHAGTEGQFFSLIRGLDRTLFDPHLLVFEESPWLRENPFPCSYTVLGHRSLKSPLTWFRLLRLGRAFRADGYRLAHVFFNDPSIICPPVLKLCGIKTLLSRRDMGYWYTPAMKGILRLTGRFASGVIVNSEAVKGVTVSAEGFAEDRVHVIYNGYEDQCTELTDSYDFENRQVMVLVANVRPIKRIEDAIEGLSLLRDTAPRLNLVVIGSGDASALKTLADARGIADRVHFLGARDDIDRCLAGADLGILCSESEGFSNALVEYMRAGLPVVCSEVGGNPEAIQHGRNGFTYPVGDVKAFSDCIHTLLEDPTLADKMADQAKTDAMERYSLATMVQSHQALYHQI